MANRRKRRSIASFIWTLILLALMSAIIVVGFKTYRKLPVLSLLDNLMNDAFEMNLNKVSEHFAPDSDVRKALDIANSIGDMPIVGGFAGNAADLIRSSFNYEVDYWDIRITINGTFAEAVVGVIDNSHNTKRYVTFNLKSINKHWYVTQLPSIKSAQKTDLAYKKTLRGYAEQGSDYLAIILHGILNRQ